MENYTTLAKAGIDVEGLLKRLMGNASLIRVFIKKFTEDKTFEALKSAFEAGDSGACEMASHTLKGMCGNLSLTELYSLFTEQVNMLRSGNIADALGMMEKITEIYNKAVALMCEWLLEC